MRIVLIHDYLREYGGAERVLEALHEIFPEAPLYTAYINWQGLATKGDAFRGWDIRTSWMQQVPFANKLISPFRIFARKIFESFDLSEYDMVISSCAIYFAKAVKVRPGALHISYIHTPPRYLYGYATSFNYKKHILIRIGGEIINHFLRIVDFETSQRPDILVANSKNVQARIKKFYQRESVIIYPPMDIGVVSHQSSVVIQFESRRLKTGSYFLALNRLVRGKGTEVIVEAATKLGISLKVAGTGPEMETLKRMAGKNVEFLGWVSDEERVNLLMGAKALIVAAEDEDFGITTVEAQAAGTPVIALRAGGYLETVIEGSTGEFFDEATPESLVEVLAKFDPKKYNALDCQKNAQKFSKERFKKEILDLIEANLHT